MCGDLRLRRGVRAVVLDGDDRVLLLRFEFVSRLHEVAGLWATPGGAVEEGEGELDALGRELAKEVGLREPEISPLIWTRTHVAPMATGRGASLPAHHEPVPTGHEIVFLPRKSSPVRSRRRPRYSKPTSSMWVSTSGLSWPVSMS